MDPLTSQGYTLIYEWKHGRTLTTKRRGFTKGLHRLQLSGLTEAELYMRCDMAANKAAWSGSFASDLWLWTKNTNQLVAFCFSHPLHPISRPERAFILLLQILLFAYIAMLLVHINECEDYRNLHPTCGDPTLDLLERTLEHVNPLATYHHETAAETCCTFSMGSLVRAYAAFDPARHRWWAGATLGI